MGYTKPVGASLLAKILNLEKNVIRVLAVSYTHLTLPTIYSV